MGAQRTKGVSFNVVGTIGENTEDRLNWSLSLNGRHQKQNYRNIGSSLELLNDELKSTSLTRYRDGGSPTDIWAVRSAGIDPMTGKEIYIKKDGSYTFDYDINDEMVVGNTEPLLEGVFGTNLYYKGFSFSAYFRYRIDADYFNTELYNRIENLKTTEMTSYNQDKRALYDRWQKPGDKAKFKSIKDTSPTPMSSRFVRTENTFSGESISMGYESSAVWIKKIGAEGVTFRAYMNDIFRVSSFKEERGTDYPFARTVSFSLSLRF